MRENNAEPITLLVVHWNNPRACLATVRALREQSPNLQIVILDNASSAEACETLGREIDIIRLPRNLGWGPALNVGVRKWLDQSRGEYCLISAHDAVPSADCVPLLLEAMNGDARIGIACPQYADGLVPRFSALHGVKLHVAEPASGGQLLQSRSDDDKKRPGSSWATQPVRRTGCPSGAERVDLAKSRGQPQFVDVPHGTLFLVRRECLREIGLFDERYFAYGDEHELGARAARHGWKVALVWGAIVANPETSTPGAWRSYLFARNSLLLVHDYFGSFAALLRAGVIAINILRNSVSRRDESFAFSAKAQWRALRDYFAGRFGPPGFE